MLGQGSQIIIINGATGMSSSISLGDSGSIGYLYRLMTFHRTERDSIIPTDQVGR